LPTRKKNLSAIKRARQAEKRHERNKAVKSGLKTASKRLQKAISEKNSGVMAPALKDLVRAYSKAASKGIIHGNTASRKISRLAKKVPKTG
jgi:small subunit ribosomal protein S20